MKRYLLSLFLLFFYVIVCAQGHREGKSTSSVSIATWNVGHFANGHADHSLISISELPQKTKEFNMLVYDSIAVDVLCLNEYSREFCCDLIKGDILAEDIIFNQFKEHKIFKQNKYVCNAIFSNVDLGQTIIQSFHYTDSVKKKKPQIEWYYYVVSDISLGDETVKLVYTHLIANAWDLCSNQISELIEACEKYEKVIICGDMNTWDFSKFQKAGYTLAHNGNVVTYPRKSYSLDNLFVKGLNISDVRVVKTELSDHYAVACTVSL